MPAYVLMMLIAGLAVGSPPPLHEAAEIGDMEKVAELLATGADIEGKEDEG